MKLIRFFSYLFYTYFILSLCFKINHIMGRNKITDGTKKQQIYFLTQERNLKILGEEKARAIAEKAVEKEAEKIRQGKIPNQINLIDAIAEVEQNKTKK